VKTLFPFPTINSIGHRPPPPPLPKHMTIQLRRFSIKIQPLHTLSYDFQRHGRILPVIPFPCRFTVIRGPTRASHPRRAMPVAQQQYAAVRNVKSLLRFPPKSAATFLALTAAISQSADTNTRRSAQFCYVRSLFQDVAGQTYTDIVKKGKVHRCRGTEALYRPYGP